MAAADEPMTALIEPLNTFMIPDLSLLLQTLYFFLFGDTLRVQRVVLVSGNDGMCFLMNTL